MTSDRSANIYANLAPVQPEEIFETLLDAPAVSIERIVSTGQTTPPGEWYDQSRDEWVLLLSGSAGLLLEGELQPMILQPGDYLHIPAHRRHRVEWTDASRPTIWLAVHFDGGGRS